MRISDWSSDVCSSDLHAALGKFLWEGGRGEQLAAPFHRAIHHRPDDPDLRTTLIALLMQAGRYGDALDEIDAARQVFGAAAWFDEVEAASASETGQKIERASWRERGCQYV